jgi:hypothetical protein
MRQHTTLYYAELHAYIQWLADHSELPKPGNTTNATEAEEEETKEETEEKEKEGEEEGDQEEKRLWPELPTFGREHKYVPATQVFMRYVSIRQHTSTYVSIRRLAGSTNMSRQHRCLRTYEIRQHTSAFVSIRQHTSAYVTNMSRQHRCAMNV